MLLSDIEKTDVVIFAFCDQGNIGSQRTVESAGFERRGLMKYDSDSGDESILYVLNWKALQKKIKERFLAVAED
jgi:RimJ/RimL family protein N-acetyltransferase